MPVNDNNTIINELFLPNNLIRNDGEKGDYF